MTTNLAEEHFVHDDFNLNSKTVTLKDDQNFKLNNTISSHSMNNVINMADKSEGENLNQANNFTLESNAKMKSEENNSATQDVNPLEKKDKFPWQFSENVKRDSFGFILRTDALPLDKAKKTDNHDVNNADPNKGKSDKKGKNGKGDDKYDDGKKLDRDRNRERDRDKRRERDRSPHGHKRKYSRSPSPRRPHHRRSRSRSRTPRDPRLRRNANSSGDRYRYRRYSAEKSPEKDAEKSDLRNSSPRRERSRSPHMGWRVGHSCSGPVDPRNPPVNMNNNMNRQDYVPMVPTAFHSSGANPVPPPTNNSPGALPPVPEGNAFNRYQPNSSAPVQVPPQYNYPPAPGTSGTESYPGYDVYYSGYPPPPPAHPQPEYAPPAANNWQRDVNPPPAKASTTPIIAEDPAKKEAIEKELLQQKLTLSKQRDEYLRKGIILNRELELLKSQKKELSGDKTRDSEKLLKENNKLQLEINTKIKAVDNVIDILTGIIGDARPTIPLEEKVESGKASGRESSREKEKSSSREKAEKKRGEKRSKESSGSGGTSSSEDSSSDSNSEYRKKMRKNKKKKRRKPEANDENLAPPGTEPMLPMAESRKEESKPVCNFIYYDPEMHWCQVCDEFPRTAKEYLNHLHSKEHKELTQEKKVNDMPWHELNVHEEIPYYEGAPTKRIPIKGLQFLVSATAWFCKLCRMWIGDLHCASLHLKSKEHSANYSSFNEQNPHWETDWMANREKAYEKCAEQRRRQRDEELLQKQKQERMELMKKQEEELKQKFFSSLMKVPESTESELIMPLTLPRSFESSSLPMKENFEVKKEKEKKKKNKKEKKKKEKRMKEKKKRSKEKKSRKSSSSESGSSSESSTESSDSEEEKKYKKEILSDLEGRSKSIRVTMRNKERSDEEKILPAQATPPPPPPPLPIPITLPEKSKWELEDVVESKGIPMPEVKEATEMKEQPVRRETQPEEKVVKEWSKAELHDSEKELTRHLKEKTKTRDRPRDREWGKGEDDRSLRYDKKRSYRDKRQESSRRERRSSWDRKKDYRSSRHRRSRSRSRSNSRERDREKVTPGVIPAPLYDLFKLPDKHGTALSDANKSERSDDMIPETEDGESKFEKQAMEAAAKKKKIQPVVNLPKSKFGFIGRMPFAKKRGEEKGKKDDESPKKDESAELEAPPPPRITQPRPPSPKTAKPVLTNKTKVETAKEIVSKYQRAFQEKVEEPVPMDPVIMTVEMTNPPLPPSPPVLTMIPPSPPKIRESPKSPKKSKKSPYPLPKDFQDALSIIYPEEKPEDKTEGYPNAEMLANTLSFQPPSMAYAGQMMMAYPGMHMMAAMPQMPPGPPVGPPPHMMNMFGQTAPVPPPPSSEPSRETPSPVMPPPPENLFETSFGLGSSTGGGIPGLEEDRMETSSKMSDDDMALLGIDAEDLAAQQL